jgi:hypothetical protein
MRNLVHKKLNFEKFRLDLKENLHLARSHRIRLQLGFNSSDVSASVRHRRLFSLSNIKRNFNIKF